MLAGDMDVRDRVGRWPTAGPQTDFCVSYLAGLAPVLGTDEKWVDGFCQYDYHPPKFTERNSGAALI